MNFMVGNNNESRAVVQRERANEVFFSCSAKRLSSRSSRFSSRLSRLSSRSSRFSSRDIEFLLGAFSRITRSSFYFTTGSFLSATTSSPILYSIDFSATHSESLLDSSPESLSESSPESLPGSTSLYSLSSSTKVSLSSEISSRELTVPALLRAPYPKIPRQF